MTPNEYKAIIEAANKEFYGTSSSHVGGVIIALINENK